MLKNDKDTFLKEENDSKLDKQTFLAIEEAERIIKNAWRKGLSGKIFVYGGEARTSASPDEMIVADRLIRNLDPTFKPYLDGVNVFVII